MLALRPEVNNQAVENVPKTSLDGGERRMSLLISLFPLRSTYIFKVLILEEYIRRQS